MPARTRAARQRPRVADLLRAFLDRSSGCARAAPPRGGRTPIPQPQKRRRPMNERAMPDAYGELIEPATLKIQRLLPGSSERVWAYLTESDLRRQWLAAGQMDSEIGAPFELVWRNSELTSSPGQRPEGFDEEHRMKSEITDYD